MIDQEKDAENNRDADLALKLSKLYKEKKDSNKQIYWLSRAQEYQSKDDLFQSEENVIAYLSGIKKINPKRLPDNSEWIYKIISACPSITTVSFGSEPFMLYGNKVLINFLANCSSITKLKVSAPTSWKARLDSDDAINIAKALKTNKSIKLLNISDQPIGDTGAIAIIDALVANPETRMERISFYSCSISETGMQHILDNIEKIPTLIRIALGENCGGKELQEKIKAILLKREQAAAEAKSQIQSVPGVNGLFPAVSEPKKVEESLNQDFQKK